MNERDMFALTRLQDMVRQWTKAKMLIQVTAMLGFSFIVQSYTNLNVICSSIGIAIIAFYLLAVHHPELNQPFSAQSLKQGYIQQKCLVLLAFLMALDLPYLSLFSLLVWYWYFRQLYHKNDHRGILLVMLFLCILYEAIMFNYDEFIAIPWGFLIFPLFLPTIGAVVFFYVFGWPILKHEDPHIYLPTLDWDDWDGYQSFSQVQTRIRTGKLGIILLSSFGLLYTAVILQCYIPVHWYRPILLMSFVWVMIQFWAMLLFKKQLCHYANVYFYANYVCIRLTWNRFRMSFEENRKQRTNFNLPLLGCSLCQKQSNVVHTVTDQHSINIYLCVCASCHTNKKSSHGTFCPYQGHFQEFGSALVAKDLSFLSESYRQNIKSYLYPDQYLIQRI